MFEKLGAVGLFGVVAMVLGIAVVASADLVVAAGLALLVEWLRQARRRQVALRFSRVPPQMREIAHVTSLERILALDGGPET